MFTKEELIEIRNLIDGSKDKLTDETNRIRNSIASKIFSKLHGCPQEEPVSEELEDAAYKFVMDNFGNPKEPLYKFDQRCFKAGAMWQKEKDQKK